jgi:hypothetical protein
LAIDDFSGSIGESHGANTADRMMSTISAIQMSVTGS